MTGKNLRKIVQPLVLMFLILKLKNISSLHSKHNSKFERQVILLEIKKKRKMTLSLGNKTIFIIKENSMKT